MTTVVLFRVVLLSIAVDYLDKTIFWIVPLNLILESIQALVLNTIVVTYVAFE
jgi:hypothetical protein